MRDANHFDTRTYVTEEETTYITDIVFFDTKRNNLFGEGKFVSPYFYGAKIKKVTFKGQKKIGISRFYENHREL